MSGRVVQLGTDVHQKVQALLPWYVGAGLDAQERASVEAHLAECPRCQSELAWERRLQAAGDDSDVPVGDVDAGFALVRARIAADTAPGWRGRLPQRLVRGWHRGPAWMRWTLLGQFAVLAALSTVLLLVTLAPDPRYRALGGPATAPGAAAGGNLIVRFRPGATEQAIRDALRGSEARLVYGPTTTDAYLLAVPPGREEAAVARLRSNGAVLLVESLDGRAAP